MKSLYNALTKNDSGPTHSHIWKGKIPPKIKMFLWLIENKAILTKDNMLKRKWVGSPTCHFCNQNESINHLFFEKQVGNCCSLGYLEKSNQQVGKIYTSGVATICWAIWKTRNKAYFGGKLLTNPDEIIIKIFFVTMVKLF